MRWSPGIEERGSGDGGKRDMNGGEVEWSEGEGSADWSTCPGYDSNEDVQNRVKNQSSDNHVIGGK